MSKLVLDKETDFVWFSPYIRSYKFWTQMEKELTGHNIGFSYIPNTTDIWARDYMPVQTTDGFVQYLYWPDYLTKRVSDRQNETLLPVQSRFTHSRIYSRDLLMLLL